MKYNFYLACMSPGFARSNLFVNGITPPPTLFELTVDKLISFIQLLNDGQNKIKNLDINDRRLAGKL